MPTYDFKCDVCDEVQEAKMSCNEEKVFRCSKCQKLMRRLISAGSGVHFKGSGFYETDYKGK